MAGLPRRVLLTGGAGFIGCRVVAGLLREPRTEVLNLDKLVFPGSAHTLEQFAAEPRHRHVQVDICDRPALNGLFAEFAPHAVMHLAAESHVDRSIDEPAAFIQSNITGTFTLLDAALAYWRGLDARARGQFRFLHVSTDEVFGSLEHGDPAFVESDPYRPRSPYAASKAAADHLAHAWYHTYGLPVVVSNCTNNYGPFQFPEKLIPLTVTRALRGQRLPVYGRGDNVRDWLWVDDHVAALMLLIKHGQAGETYNISAGNERSNLDIVTTLCALLDESVQDPGGPRERLIEFVADRPGHDFRYAMNSAKIRQQFGWAPAVSLSDGLRRTVDWYLRNTTWCEGVTAGAYDGQRLGISGA